MHILQVGLEHFLYGRIKNMFGDIPVRKNEAENVKKTGFNRGIVLPPELVKLIEKFEYIELHIHVYKKPPDKGVTNYDIKKLGEKVVKLRGTMPPCMAFILRKFSRGENVSHFERLTIATFLFARQDSMEQIMEIFQKAPNFDEKITSYQLKQIKNGEYKTPNCEKIDNSGFCFRNPTICGGCANPLQLIGTAR